MNIKNILRIVLVGFFTLYVSLVFSQSLKEQRETSENIRLQQQIERDKRIQEELNTINAASQFGTVFYCKEEWKTRAFHNGRVFFNFDNQDYTNLKGTIFEEKMYYKLKGDWISYKIRGKDFEINQVTGDTYIKFHGNPHIIERKADCKKVR